MSAHGLSVEQVVGDERRSSSCDQHWCSDVPLTWIPYVAQPAIRPGSDPAVDGILGHHAGLEDVDVRLFGSATQGERRAVQPVKGHAAS